MILTPLKKSPQFIFFCKKNAKKIHSPTPTPSRTYAHAL